MRGNAGARLLQQQRQRARIAAEVQAPHPLPHGARVDGGLSHAGTTDHRQLEAARHRRLEGG